MKKEAKLKGKTALITGATGTIGGAIALAFAREGSNLILNGSSPRKLKELLKRFAEFPNLKVEAICADVSNKKSVQQLFKKIEKKFKAIDILVAAAGTYGAIGTLEQTEPEEWMEAIEINLLGTFMTIKYALPNLRKSSLGKIIAFGGGGEGPLERHSSYVASKAAVLRMVETLSVELAPIEINAISPGLVASGLTQQIIDAGPLRAGRKRYRDAMKERKGKGGIISPEKAASLAVFLASADSNGISGKSLSAVRDKWQNFSKHTKEIMESDVYNIRRIKPKDRGYDWQ